MSVELNVLARKAANEFVELGIDFAAEQGLGPDEMRLYWQVIMELSAKLIGDKVLCDHCQTTAHGRDKPKPQYRGPRLHDDSPFPFGKYKDEPCGEIPDDYYHWLSKQSWIDEWPNVLQYIECGDG